MSSSVDHSEEPLYRSMVEQLPHPVATVLIDGTLVFVNRAMESLLGASGTQLVATSLLAHVDPAEHDSLKALLSKALNDRQEGEFTLRVAGQPRRMQLGAKRLPMAEVDAVTIVVADLSDQVARSVAEALAAVKSKLIAAFSEELRSPLTSMLGRVELLEYRLKDDSRVMHDLTNLKNAIQTQVRIVSDLLDLAETEKDAFRIEPDQFDLRRAIISAIDFMALAAKNKSVALKVDVPHEQLVVIGDSDRLGKVMLHLVANAVKFTGSGGMIHIRAARVDSHVEVSIEDNGPGIPAELLPFVFEPFRRGDAPPEPGLGIGLAVARRIVEAHGGTVHAASSGAGSGATFVVQIPLANKMEM